MKQKVHIARGEDRHHLFYESRFYKQGLEQQFRNYKGLVIPIDIEVHRELHTTLYPPLRPTTVNMLGCMDYLDTEGYNASNSIDYFKDHAVGNQRANIRIADHLERQLGFIVLCKELIAV